MMRKFLEKYWIEISFLDLKLDLMDCLCIDIGNIMCGTEDGIKLYGSFFMLYWEPDYHLLPVGSHFTWDIFYLRQWWKSCTDPKD